jgi:hypothetical protein
LTRNADEPHVEYTRVPPTSKAEAVTLREVRVRFFKVV